MRLACTYLGPADEGQCSHNALFGMEQQRKGKPCIAKFIAQYPAVLVQPFAAEEKVFWGLLGSTATAWAVCFANAE